MTRLAPRSRPRNTSVDFSRLWWLLATEAAYQVWCSHNAVHWYSTPFRCSGHWTIARLARMREIARDILAGQVVRL